jgi:3-dehydroquinate dehydratase / shikimate dehydrogenase
MAALLCETVTGETMGDVLAMRDAAGAADMIELRLDGVQGLDVDRALNGRRKPVIVTCRPKWEGGRFAGSEQERRAVLAQALSAGAEYVDIEWKALRQTQDMADLNDLLEANRDRVVLSTHDFTGVPADLFARVRAMRTTGAAVIKVAVTAFRLSDTLPLLDIARAGDAVVIGMGDAGVPSRLLATRFGSRWTYGGTGVAPGQIPAARMVDEFRYQSIGDRTAIYGLGGEQALRSPIPATRNAGFSAAGVDAVCIPLPVSDAADIDSFAAALGIIGWERCT